MAKRKSLSDDRPGLHMRTQIKNYKDALEIRAQDAASDPDGVKAKLAVINSTCRVVENGITTVREQRKSRLWGCDDLSKKLK